MNGEGDGGPEPFRLLFVCTGNICRSPFAQFHTRALLATRMGPRWASWFSVASGGTGAVVGAEMHPLSRAQLGPLATHPDVASFHARQLPARDVALADLVLTMSRSHRSAVLELEPRALRATFTIPEFARLLRGVDLGALPADPLARAGALVGAVLGERGRGGQVDPDEDAVPDPISGSVGDHAAAARLVHASVRPVVDAIAAAVPWPARPQRPGPPPRPPGPPPGRPGAPPPGRGPFRMPGPPAGPAGGPAMPVRSDPLAVPDARRDGDRPGDDRGSLADPRAVREPSAPRAGR